MSNKQKQIKLLELVQKSITFDEELRAKYQVEDKFRFIRERLKALLEQIQKELEVVVAEEKENKFILSSDEIIIYVHLFNTKGLVLNTWKNMILPKVFYEYSVNRPIYAEKKDIDAMIKAKLNKMQHGYLAIAINKSNILPALSKDNLSSPLIKVKEGSLRYERFLTFTHNEQDYVLNEEREFIKK